MPVSRKRPSVAVRTKKTRTAEHRPATRKRRYRHDDVVAVDLFSGFGGLTWGLGLAGITTILAANHNPYKTSVHEANHPDAEHWIADLVDEESSDYHSAADLPAADVLVAGVSCTNHSGANTQKAYAQGLTLFELDHDEEYEARVTRSERDRATALCVLQYAQKNHPMMILVECTTELVSWGPALQNRPKVGDGSTYRWWRRELANLEYDSATLYLNSMFFGVGQSRDRLFIVLWDKRLPAPDLEHRPEAFCQPCDRLVEAKWTWKTGVPPTGTVRYGQQYHYTCPRCRRRVEPPATPSLAALDLSDLGRRIGDRDEPLADSTYGRAGRCLERFPDFPPIMFPGGQVSTGAAIVAAGNSFERPGSNCRSRDLTEPLWTQTATNQVGLLTPPVALSGSVIAARRHNGDGKHLSQPMDTNTSTHEKGVVFAAIDNYQGAPRHPGEPLPTQGGSETMALVTSAMMPLRNKGVSRGVDEPAPAATASETLSLVSTAVMPFRQHTLPAMHSEPVATMTAEQLPGLVTTKGRLLGGHGDWRDRWREMLAALTVDDLFFRMLFKWEVGRACGFDPEDFPGQAGTFKVWGNTKQQIDGYGNAVSPGVAAFLGRRMRRSLHSRQGLAIPRPRFPLPTS